MKCNDCKYWTHYKGKREDGQCRRYSPEVIADVSGAGFLTGISISTKGLTKWPSTAYDDWCGEFESNQPITPNPPLVAAQKLGEG